MIEEMLLMLALLGSLIVNVALVGQRQTLKKELEKMRNERRW